MCPSMNTINISGWQACVCGFERRTLLVLTVVLMAPVLSAQMNPVPNPVPSQVFVPGTADAVLALKYSGSPAAGGRIAPTTVVLRKNFTQLAALDAQHALKQTPRPLVRAAATGAAPKRARSSSIWQFSLTGPKAKLVPTPAQSSP